MFKKFYWKLERWPHFSWKWRAEQLPKGAVENDPKTNDSACGVYVAFDGYNGEGFKYVWSTTLPVGTVVEKRPGRFYLIVLESGSKALGDWKTETVNVLADYERIFKKEPSNDPAGFGLLTDGNATHSPAACDYDDFKITENP